LNMLGFINDSIFIWVSQMSCFIQNVKYMSEEEMKKGDWII
jgi:hypothetical protein